MRSEDATKAEKKELDKLNEGERRTCFEGIHKRREINGVSAPQVRFIASFWLLIDCTYRNVKFETLNI